MEELKEILKKNDVNEARALLNNEILWNSSNEEMFYKMVDICESYNVFDKSDEKIEDKDISEYTESDLIDLNTNLNFNFSKERCLLTYKVSRYLNEKKAKKKEDGDFSKNEKVIYTSTENYKLDDENDDIIKKISIVGGVVLGVAIILKLSKRKKQLKRLKR